MRAGRSRVLRCPKSASGRSPPRLATTFIDLLDAILCGRRSNSNVALRAIAERNARASLSPKDHGTLIHFVLRLSPTQPAGMDFIAPSVRRPAAIRASNVFLKMRIRVTLKIFPATGPLLPAGKVHWMLGGNYAREEIELKDRPSDDRPQQSAC